MLIVRLRNLLVNWPDPVIGAHLYLNPAGHVYPAPASDRNVFETTNAGGEAKLSVAALLPGEHTLWIVPKHSTPDLVGHLTATGPDTARIFRGLRIQFTIGDRNNVTSATVHPTTAENGKLLANVANVKDQVFEIRLQPMWIKSPYNYQRTQKIDMIVVHRTGGDVIGPAINTMLKGGASAHYIVDRDGQIVKMVVDSQAAGHASHENSQDQSHWGTQTALAWRSIGIETVGTVKQGLTSAQYKSLIRLIHELMTAHSILRHRVVGHSDILTDGAGALSNDRIACPGYQFEWSQLENAKPAIGLARSGGSSGNDPLGGFFAAMNIGATFTLTKPLVLQENDFDPQTVSGKLKPGKFGGQPAKDNTETPIKHLQTMLAEIGYSVGPANGVFNYRTKRAVRHFGVHFENRSDIETVNQQTAALISAVRAANPKAD